MIHSLLSNYCLASTRADDWLTAELIGLDTLILQAAFDHPASYCVHNIQSAQSNWLWFSAIIPNSKPFNVLMMYTNGQKMDLVACD